MATAHLSAAVTHSRAIRWQAAECQSMGTLAVTLAETGQLHRAERLIDRTLALSRRLGGTLDEAGQLGTRGLIRLNLGNLASAADDFAAARDLFQAGRSLTGAALMLTNQGWAHLFRDRLTDADACLTSSLALHHEHQHRLGAAGANAGLGELHAVLGDVPTAVDYATAAVEVARAIHDPRVASMALIVFAHAYLAADDTERATRYAWQASRHADEQHNRYLLSAAQLALANARLAAGAPDQAATHARHCLALATTDGYGLLEGDARTALAEIHLRHGRPILASATAQRALANHRRVGNRRGEARTLAILDEVHRAGSAQ
jgi:tetratricopeptide (TPR) repeat protein